MELTVDEALSFIGKVAPGPSQVNECAEQALRFTNQGLGHLEFLPGNWHRKCLSEKDFPERSAPICKKMYDNPKVVADTNGKPVGEAPLIAQADVERSGLMLRSWQHVVKWVGK